MRLLAAFVVLSCLSACAAKPLTKRVPGRWLIDHYDEYAAGRSTGHLYDRCGYIFFRKDGTGGKKLSTTKPAGSLAVPYTFRYLVSNADSVISILAPGGREVERWLVTSNQATYQEWVSVNESRDTVRTMYLMKR